MSQLAPEISQLSQRWDWPRIKDENEASNIDLTDKGSPNQIRLSCAIRQRQPYHMEKAVRYYPA